MKFSFYKLQVLLTVNDKEERVVIMNGRRETVQIPIILLQDPRVQTINQREYQIIAKDLNSKNNYWNNSKKSFVYEGPEEMKYYENILKHLPDYNILDNLPFLKYNITRVIIMDEKIDFKAINGKYEYIYEWANGEYEDIWLNSDEECLAFWRSKAGGRMPIISIYCPDTDKFLQNPNV